MESPRRRAMPDPNPRSWYTALFKKPKSANRKKILGDYLRCSEINNHNIS
jgi:hypothetical protein